MKHKKRPATTKALTRQLGSVATLVAGLAMGGCSGSINGDGKPNEAQPPGSSASGAGGGGSSAGGGQTAGSTGSAPLTGPGRVVLHRLNVVEYNNTIRDLLGTNQRLAESFPPDFTAFGFDNVASALTLTDVTFGYFFEAAKRVAAEALSSARRNSLVGCDLATGREACVTTALNGLLPKAWRRPIEAGDVEPLVALYSATKADGNTDDDAFARVLQAVLMAPEFLYRVERNSGVAAVRELTSYELASRLSYFLWSTMPDAELTASAASGALKDTAGLASQLTRMLASDKAAALTENFGSQWLPVRELQNAKPSLGRGPRVGSDFDAFIVDEVSKAFTASGQLFPKLVEAMVTRLLISDSSPEPPLPPQPESAQQATAKTKRLLNAAL